MNDEIFSFWRGRWSPDPLLLFAAAGFLASLAGWGIVTALAIAIVGLFVVGAVSLRSSVASRAYDRANLLHRIRVVERRLAHVELVASAESTSPVDGVEKQKRKGTARKRTAASQPAADERSASNPLSAFEVLNLIPQGSFSQLQGRSLKTIFENQGWSSVPSYDLYRSPMSNFWLIGSQGESEPGSNWDRKFGSLTSQIVPIGRLGLLETGEEVALSPNNLSSGPIVPNRRSIVRHEDGSVYLFVFDDFGIMRSVLLKEGPEEENGELQSKR